VSVAEEALLVLTDELIELRLLGALVLAVLVL
jgi:hypothetical protein